MRGWLFTMLVLLSVTTVAAHETDNFTVPRDQQFADLTPVFSEMFFESIRHGVDQTNEQIRKAVESGSSRAKIEKLQTPVNVAAAVRSYFPPPWAVIGAIEELLHSKDVRKRYPGQLVSYKASSCVYDFSKPFYDPLQLVFFWRASTIKVNDVYIGIDKIGHFVGKGHINYAYYRETLKKGKGETEAWASVVNVGTGNHILYSENGLVGTMTSGMYSNADLVADYTGAKFFVNLTDPVTVKGKQAQPMLVRDGDYWHIAPHVTPTSDFWTRFVTQHWNEVHNPNWLPASMLKIVKRSIIDRSDNLLKMYCDRHGNRNTRHYFEQRLKELSTYYGEDYGHKLKFDEVMSLQGSCLKPHEFSKPNERARTGESAVHAAAGKSNTAQLKQLLDGNADMNDRVRSLETCSAEWGNTPLHCAARVGNTGAISVLLARGADVDAQNDRGLTPLHRAVRFADVVTLLIAKNADANAVDEQGRTALHLAAAFEDTSVIRELIKAGAKVDQKDNEGRTPLHHAAEWGQTAVAATLVSSNSNIDDPAKHGVTPLHIATQKNHAAFVRFLLDSNADANAADDFEWTPLHDAAERGSQQIAQMLIDKGAKVTNIDAYRSTPLHQAAQRGHMAIIELLVKSGGSVAATDCRGHTALHCAASQGHKLAYRQLVKKGADEKLRDKRGKTASQLAKSATSRIVEMFQRDRVMW